jgi:hypothetical protein
MRDDAARALREYEDFLARPYERRFERSSGRSGSSRAAAAATALRERPASEPASAPKPAPEPRRTTAPGRAYGSHRRDQGVPGGQPGRRTVQITGQVQAPRRRYETQAAFAARPDRAALWAFLFAMFLVLMAIATAHG